MSQIELQLIKSAKYAAAAIDVPEMGLPDVADVYTDQPNKAKPSLDIIQQFRSNMGLVEELQRKLEFMTLEIKDVVKKL